MDAAKDDDGVLVCASSCRKDVPEMLPIASSWAEASMKGVDDASDVALRDSEPVDSEDN